MPKNLSALKRVQVTSRNRLQNKKYKVAIKKSVKKYLLNIKGGQEEAVKFFLSVLYQKIDKAIKKGIVHKNAGSRKKSRLAAIFHNQ
uniref:Small ribosomal subunit protein bS20c n=1 Tax=Taenioma perpusillum TaxID=210852 RepID=A0A1Z1MQY3_9FLOR|nr:ribosomal protein S20 [Taenioma perpusillum]ARW68503.1 ribosomal protein S20 [Taenioma perpusillum]